MTPHDHASVCFLHESRDDAVRSNFGNPGWVLARANIGDVILIRTRNTMLPSSCLPSRISRNRASDSMAGRSHQELGLPGTVRVPRFVRVYSALCSSTYAYPDRIRDSAASYISNIRRNRVQGQNSGKSTWHARSAGGHWVPAGNACEFSRRQLLYQYVNWHQPICRPGRDRHASQLRCRSR